MNPGRPVWLVADGRLARLAFRVALPDFKHWERKKELTTFEEAIARAAGMDETEWPELRKRDHDSPRNDCSEEINSLRAECAQIARELEIAASTLAPRAALEAIASSRPRTVDEIMKTGGLLCWQAELVQGAVKKCLHSTR